MKDDLQLALEQSATVAVSVPLRGYRHESSALTFTEALTLAFPSPCGVIGMKVLSFLLLLVLPIFCFRPLAGL